MKEAFENLYILLFNFTTNIFLKYIECMCVKVEGCYSSSRKKSFGGNKGKDKEEEGKPRRMLEK